MKLTAALNFPCVLGPQWVTTAADRPNILVILADDMGWGDLGANNPKGKTAKQISGELYNLCEDFAKQHNLFIEQPGRAQKMQTQFKTILAK